MVRALASLWRYCEAYSESQSTAGLRIPPHGCEARCTRNPLDTWEVGSWRQAACTTCRIRDQLRAELRVNLRIQQSKPRSCKPRLHKPRRATSWSRRSVVRSLCCVYVARALRVRKEQKESQVTGFSSSGGRPSAVESSACCTPLRDVLRHRALSLRTQTSLSFDTATLGHSSMQAPGSRMQPQTSRVLPSGAREFGSAAADSAGCGGCGPAAVRRPALPGFVHCLLHFFLISTHGQ